MLTIPFCRLFGARGVAVLPILGTLAVLGCFLALLPGGRFPARAAPMLGAVLLFATPFAFYSLTFWEMTCGCAFLCGAVLAAARRRYLLCGVLIGAGLWLREELYFAGAALAAALWFTAGKERRRAAAMLALGALPFAAALWLTQWVQSGHILGLHGALYYTHNTDGDAPSLAKQLAGALAGYRFYGFGHIAPRILLIAPALLIAGGALPRCRAMFRAKTGVLIGAGLSFLLLTLAVLRLPAGAAGLSVGLIPSLPVAAGFWLNWRPLSGRGNPQTRLLACFVLFYTLLLPPFLTRSDIGVIWGPRHFLFTVPFLLLLSAEGVRRMGARRSRAVQTGIVLTLAAAFGLEFHGLQMLHAVSGESAEITAAIRETPGETVVSDVFFLPEQTPELFFERKWLFVKSSSQIPELLAVLRAGKVREFTLVLSPTRRRIDDAHLQMLLTAAPPTRPVRELPGRKSGFLALLIAECRLQ